jgi:hypothetical protein
MRYVDSAPIGPATAEAKEAKKVRKNWWHPVLTVLIVQAVASFGSLRAAVRHLVVKWPTLFAGLNESTLRTWFVRNTNGKLVLSDKTKAWVANQSSF